MEHAVNNGMQKGGVMDTSVAEHQRKQEHTYESLCLCVLSQKVKSLHGKFEDG